MLASDVLPPNDWRTQRDFLQEAIPRECDCIITNPPFSRKDEFLSRCYASGKPFALLMKIDALEGRERQRLYREYGLELIFLPERANFTTTDGRIASGTSSSWFATAWFTHRLDIGDSVSFWAHGEVLRRPSGSGKERPG